MSKVTREIDEHDVAVTLHRAADRRCGGVGAAIVDQYDLEIVVGAQAFDNAGDAVDQRRDVLRFVVEWDDDAEQRPAVGLHGHKEVFNLTRAEPSPAWCKPPA